MVSIIFIILAAIFKAVMDIIQFKYTQSIFYGSDFFKWINPKISWKNKWKQGNPILGEAYFGSSTIFVWTTDLWHFTQMLMLFSFMLAIVLYKPIINWFIDLIILHTIFSGIFELFWSKILKNK